VPGGHLRNIFLCLLAAGLAGCAALPSAGPTSTEVVANESTTEVITGYVVIDIDARVTSILAKRASPTLYGMFKDGRLPPDVRIGTGDAVTITIWEAASGGLFSTASIDRNSPGSRTATIPEQTVAQNGTVQVPYAGRLKLAGLRPAEAEALIVESLKGKAIEPQAVVTITRNRNNTVTVTGEVTNGMLAVAVRRGWYLRADAGMGAVAVAAELVDRTADTCRVDRALRHLVLLDSPAVPHQGAVPVPCAPSQESGANGVVGASRDAARFDFAPALFHGDRVRVSDSLADAARPQDL
jgi:hypothetical protein